MQPLGAPVVGYVLSGYLPNSRIRVEKPEQKGIGGTGNQYPQRLAI